MLEKIDVLDWEYDYMYGRTEDLGDWLAECNAKNHEIISFNIHSDGNNWLAVYLKIAN